MIPIDPDALADMIVIDEDMWPDHEEPPAAPEWAEEVLGFLPTARHRSVVEMVVWGGMTRKEIADELGISQAYVYRLWREARMVLREVIPDVQI